MSSPENHPPAGTRATKSPADGFSRRTKIHEGHDVQVYLRTLRDFVMIQTGAALAAFALQGGVGLTGVDLFQRQRSIRRHVACPDRRLRLTDADVERKGREGRKEILSLLCVLCDLCV